MRTGVRYSSPHHLAAWEAQRRESMEEELRLLYVGMTRARDRLYLVGKVGDGLAAERRWKEDAERHPGADEILRAKCALDWIGPVAARGDVIGVREAQGGSSRAAPTGKSFVRAIREAEPDEEALRALRRLPDEEAPRDEGTAAGISATELAFPGGVLRRRLLSPEPFPDPRAMPPDFVGRLTHTFLERLDMDAVRRAASRVSLTAQLDELVRRALLPEDARKAVDLESLSLFFSSEWGKRVLEADSILRELPFSMLTGPDSSVLLQGKMDLLAVTGKRVFIVDFKTNKIAENEALQTAREYQGQLWAYRRAAQTITGAAVEAVVLYFTEPRRLLVDPDLETTDGSEEATR